MNELQLTEQSPTPLTVLQTAIESKVDPESLERLMALQERWEDRNAKKAFNAAFVGFQSEMPTVYKGRDGVKAKYASYDDIFRIARPFLKKHGLSVSFSQEDTATEIKVVCRVMHEDGHSVETPFTLPKDTPLQTNAGKSVTNLAQAQGSANSYAKRYCLTNALNIIVGDQDDDANAMNTPVETITEDQQQEIRDLLERSGADEGALLQWANANSIEEFPMIRYAKAVSSLKTKIEKGAAS